MTPIEPGVVPLASMATHDRNDAAPGPRLPDRPRALGFATDLALARLQGGLVEERPGYLVLRMPANPTFHWGNCLILDGPPERGSLGGWVDTFRAEHPEAGHVAIGIDTAEADIDPAEAAARGLEVGRDVVLTTSGPVDDPRGPTPGIDCRAVPPADEDAWRRLVEMEVRDEGGHDPEGHRTFVTRRYEGIRGLVRAGHGAWYAAYLPDGQPVSTLGLFSVGPGLARYQSVLTDARHRGRGIAGTLLRYAGRHGLADLGARSLVIVADPEGPAIGLYRAAGFTDHDQQWALYRAPG